MLAPGVQLSGRYRLHERIGGGGMGDVWRATDEVLGRTVAVKVLLPALLDEPGFAERFRGEARTMASINHPGVVDVYDYGTDDGGWARRAGGRESSSTAYLVMEYVEGDALATTLSRVGRLTPARTMALVAQAADALHAAHEKGIVHRDVKPGNLLVRPNGTLVLTDFGIARSALVGHLTVAGSVLGTASYISPEQAAGGIATPASDVYSLGVVAYQCLAGHRPFEGDTPLEIAMKHVRAAPPPLPPDTPPTVRAVVERAMAKDPPARWASAAQLAAVARQAAASSGTPSGPAPATVPARPAAAAQPRVPASAPAARVAGPVSRPAAPPPRVVSPPRTVSAPANWPASSPRTVSAPANWPASSPRVAAPLPRPAAAPGGTRFMPQPSYPHGAPVAARRPGRHNAWLIVLAVVLALAIVVCSGVIAYGWANRENNSGGYDSGHGTSGSAGTRGTTAGAVRAGVIDIPCNLYRLQKFEKVKDKLRDSDFQVVRRDVPGPGQGRVVDVAPCQAPRGAAVTVKVATGKVRHD